MDTSKVDAWLRKEAEKLTKEYNAIDEKIINKAKTHNFDKINNLYIKRQMIFAQEVKIYEMIGRIFELKSE